MAIAYSVATRPSRENGERNQVTAETRCNWHRGAGAPGESDAGTIWTLGANRATTHSRADYHRI